MSLVLQKIAGAVLFALILVVGINLLVDTVVPPNGPPAKGEKEAKAPPQQAAAPQAPPGQPAPQQPAPAAAPAPAPAGGSPAIGPRLAKADVAAGQATAKKCAACHTFEEGGPNRVGPNLHGVVGRDIASVQGFAYSESLAKMPGTWTYEQLDAFLTSPKTAAPGTKMTFAGLPDAQERANVIAYLKSISPNAPAPPQ